MNNMRLTGSVTTPAPCNRGRVFAIGSRPPRRCSQPAAWTLPRFPVNSIPRTQFMQQFTRRQVVASAAVEEVILPTPASSEALETDSTWLAHQIKSWLDEEWTPLEIHTRVGAAAGKAYVQARVNGLHEAGDILLSICSQLMQFDFKETFTNGFEVGNKTIELLMLRQGCDVCCTSERDRERAAQNE